MSNTAASAPLVLLFLALDPNQWPLLPNTARPPNPCSAAAALEQPVRQPPRQLPLDRVCGMRARCSSPQKRPVLRRCLPRVSHARCPAATAALTSAFDDATVGREPVALCG
ncbi:hypothetical protein MRX96_013563 [Rhipicephalus microplus]